MKYSEGRVPTAPDDGDEASMLAAREARYRGIVEAQHELISLARPDGSLIYVNAAYARHFGRTAAQMIGTDLFALVPDGERASVRQLIADVLQRGAIGHGENRLVAPDRTDRWIAWTNSRLVEADGSVLLHSVGRDVTDRKAAEAALHESRSFLVRTGRAAGVGGWQLDLRSSALSWSDETRRIHEVAPDYVPTLEGAIAFYAPESRPLIEAAVQAGMRDGTPWDLELPFITSRGRRIWVRAVGEVEFEHGQPVRLVGAFQDITERKALQERLAESERFVREVTDSLPVRIAYVDRERRFRFVNRAHCLRFGLEREQILGRTRSELAGGVGDAQIEPRVLAVLGGQPQRFEYDDVVGGLQRRIESQLIPDVDAAGAVRGFFSTGIDITERSANERALRSVAEAMPAVVAVVGADMRYRFVNSAFERWIGSPRERIVGRTVREVIGRIDQERSQPWIDRALAGESVGFERVYEMHGPSRHFAVSYVPLWADSGAIDGFVGVLQDISGHRHEAVRLRQLSQLDALTGLLNRAGFEQMLEQQVQAGDAASLALLYIDLDRFKPVNDQHGHPAGDAVLQQFAQRLRSLVRPTDAVARLGGDEFVVLLVGVRQAMHADAVAAKVTAAAQAPYEVGALRLCVGASVGVAHGAAAGGAELLARADAMLYRAKNAARGTHASEPSALDVRTPDPS